MGNNINMGQLTGPFPAQEELFKRIKNNASFTPSYIKHLGIQTEISSIVYINGNEIEIGKTGIYEIGNTKITSLYFKEDADKYTIIDYIIE